MFPSVILSSAVRHLKVVDLPAPLIPSRIKHSSFLILKDIPLTASCSLKVFFREPTVICSLGNLPWRIYSTRVISVLTDESIEFDFVQMRQPAFRNHPVMVLPAHPVLLFTVHVGCVLAHATSGMPPREFSCNLSGHADYQCMKTRIP